MTVTGANGSGYLSIGPSMTSSPSTSTLNFEAGQTLANNVTLRIGSGGRVSTVIVGAAGLRADVLLDVTGYYLNGSGGAHWYPVARSRRLVDTRIGQGPVRSVQGRRDPLVPGDRRTRARRTPAPSPAT